jgi:protein tyrosine phosphatase (PTP) superfamily phosphohydrolase (DUF442 family)
MKILPALLLVLLMPCAARAAAGEQVGLLELVNYYEYSPTLLSSGQPTREQFPAIAKAGVEAVINLAPVTEPGALADEAEVVGKLGMGYAHIPVDWNHPPRADVERFLSAMDGFRGKRVLVHCYAGSRASAFVFLYRVLKLGADRVAARTTLEAIWANNPGYELPAVPQWRQLIDDELAANTR